MWEDQLVGKDLDVESPRLFQRTYPIFAWTDLYKKKTKISGRGVSFRTGCEGGY